MKQIVKEIIEKAFYECIRVGHLQSRTLPDYVVEIPKNKGHGDFATNIALLLASTEKRSPREIAKLLVACIEQDGGDVQRIEIAGPGFINFQLKDELWYATLEVLSRQREHFGSCNMGAGQSVQVEFVSANPTGPLHIGHGRGAALGDALANILAFTGYSVKREYYINDVGNQMHQLGKSVYLRYLELLKQAIHMPDDIYKGEYIITIAKDAVLKYGNRFLETSEAEAVPFFSELASKRILREIEDDLAGFGVRFDSWFSEGVLLDRGDVQASIDELRAKELVYEQDGALWFKTTRFGDEKDRVIRKEDGSTTYFASDAAYHWDKYRRGFQKVIDIWGADHHGYVPRMRGVLEALGITKDAFQVILVQMVNLLRGGKPVAMSTRAGEFVTLREVMQEVGKDAARFIFLTRRADAQLDFDLEVAKKQSDENPVFYVQYGHARICSIIAYAKQQEISIPDFHEIDPTLLATSEEKDLIKKLAQFPEVVLGGAQALEPHRIAIFLLDLVGQFHSFYNKYRVITEQLEMSKARLYLMNGIRCVLSNGLMLLGVNAPSKM
jgi:arginyl-tRNA synthetase